MKLFGLFILLYFIEDKGTSGDMEFYSNLERSMVNQRKGCVRCGGYLVKEDFVDLGGTCEPLMTVACRCMNCGNVVDELIIQHQKSPPPRPIKGGSHSPGR